MKKLILLLTMLFCLSAQYTNIKPQNKSLRDVTFNQLVSNFLNGEISLPNIDDRVNFNIDGFNELLSLLPYPLNEEFENALYENLSYRLSQEYKQFQNIQTYHANIISICISADNQFILTGGNDSYLNIWRFNGNEYKHFQALVGHNVRINPSRISFIDISHDNEFIITASPDDNTVNIWRFDGQQYQYFQPLEHDHLISAATISHDKQKILVGCADETTIKLWDFNKNKLVKPIPFRNPTESFIWNFNPKTYSEVFEAIYGKHQIKDYGDELIESFDTFSIHKKQNDLTKLNRIKNQYLKKYSPITFIDTIFTRFTTDKSIMIAGSPYLPLNICQITSKGFVVSQQLPITSTIGNISVNTEFIVTANGSSFNIIQKTTPKLSQYIVDLFEHLKERHR